MESSTNTEEDLKKNKYWQKKNLEEEQVLRVAANLELRAGTTISIFVVCVCMNNDHHNPLYPSFFIYSPGDMHFNGVRTTHSPMKQVLTLLILILRNQCFYTTYLVMISHTTTH